MDWALLLIHIGGTAAALFGLFAGVRTWMVPRFPKDRMTVAVNIRTKEDADSLELLLHEAKSAFFRIPDSRFTVLWDSALSPDGILPDGAQAVLRRYRADVIFVDF